MTLKAFKTTKAKEAHRHHRAQLSSTIRETYKSMNLSNWEDWVPVIHLNQRVPNILLRSCCRTRSGSKITGKSKLRWLTSWNKLMIKLRHLRNLMREWFQISSHRKRKKKSSPLILRRTMLSIAKLSQMMQVKEAWNMIKHSNNECQMQNKIKWHVSEIQFTKWKRLQDYSQTSSAKWLTTSQALKLNSTN